MNEDYNRAPVERRVMPETKKENEMVAVTVEDVNEVLTRLVDRSDAELMALEEHEMAADWSWRWDGGMNIEWNTYRFSQELETHKWRCRRWEERHNGSCCVVERVRDKYVMPRVREFLEALTKSRST